MFPDILFFFISKNSLSVTSSGLVLVKISCILSHETIFCLTRISHVSSISWDLWRTHETWDFLVRQEIFSWDRRQEIFSWGPLPTRKSPVSRENLMSHAFSINPMRKSHEIWDYLMRQQTGDFVIGAPPHKKISCLTRKSHVSCIP